MPVRARSEIHHFLPLLILLALLGACDKRSDAGRPADPDRQNPGPKITRVDRPPRADAPDTRMDRPPRADAPDTRVDRPPHADAADAGGDLRAAFDKAREIGNPEQREEAIAQIAWDALELDPGLTREAFQQLSADSQAKIRLIQHFAMTLAAENVDEAIKWADALGSAKEIAAARCQIALALADVDPQRAADLLSESAIAGREFDVAVVQVLQQWAGSNPPAAAAWVALFPPGESREAGIKAVISPWLESDVPAVFAWMENLGDESLRAEASAAMAGLLSEQTDEDQTEWLRHASPAMRGAIERQLKEADQTDPPPSE